VNGGGVGANVQVINAENDTRAAVSPMQAGQTPGMMVVTPNRAVTLVFSAADSLLTFISNGQQAASAQLTLPGFTESIVVSPDSQTAYAAVPTATVVGQSPGVVKIVNLNTGAFKGELSIPAVRYLAIGHNGNRILAFSDNSDTAAVITPANIGTSDPVIVNVGGFDRPVAAFFSGDDNTAFVVNCGRECGGTQASVQRVDLTTDPKLDGLAAAVPAATVAVVSGATMFLAGTPFPDPDPFPCTGGQTTTSTSCGLLTGFDLTSMTVLNTADIVITDGYHNRMALGADGQLFIGARTCTEITTADEVRGCLSIYNTLTNAVPVIPPANGDVTGIEPIAKRHVVYLVQGGELQIYDTTTSKLQTTQIDISGEVVDVKVVDF
jgi:hypothetical protein